MQLGSYEIPENRLHNAISDAKKIYDAIKNGQLLTKDIGDLYGYKDYATGVFYRRLNSMISYGLIEQVGRGSFRVTRLGEILAYPENTMQEKKAKSEAVLKVGLWVEMYKEYKKTSPPDNFWVKLKSITGIDAPMAQKVQGLIRKWYIEDIANVSDEDVEENVTVSDTSKSLSSKEGNTKAVSQQLVSPDQEKLEFGGAVLVLPKKDLKKEWEKLQKYMQIFLEDYKSETSEVKTESDQQ